MFDPSQMMSQAGGPPPTLSIPGSGGGDGPDNSSAQAALKAAASALQQALQAEKDPEDRALISKILASVHQIEASRQKEKDAAIGVSPALKHVRRGTGSGY